MNRGILFMFLAILLSQPLRAQILPAPAGLRHLHTGPGEAYPTFYALRAGEPLTVLRARGGWLQLRTRDGQRGWLPETALGVPPPRHWWVSAAAGRWGAEAGSRLGMTHRRGGVAFAMEGWGGAGRWSHQAMIQARVAAVWEWRGWGVEAGGGAGYLWLWPRPAQVAARATAESVTEAGAALRWGGERLALRLDGRRYWGNHGPPRDAWSIGLEVRP